MPVTQSHYRWGGNSGTESSHPFLAAEDTPITLEAGVTVLLRIGLQCGAAELESNLAAD
jgi:hypothetical protein